MRPDSDYAAYVCIRNPREAEDCKEKLLARPFDSKSAPALWGRAVTFILFLPLNQFALITGAYVENVFAVESCRVGKYGFRPIEML